MAAFSTFYTMTVTGGLRACADRRDVDRRGGTQGEYLRAVHRRVKSDFFQPGKPNLVAGWSGPSTREAQLEAETETAEWTPALGWAVIEVRVWTKGAEGRLDPTKLPARSPVHRLPATMAIDRNAIKASVRMTKSR